MSVSNMLVSPTCSRSLPFICNDERYKDPTQQPTARPTGEGSSLVLNGWNLFTADVAGSSLLHRDYLVDAIAEYQVHAGV